MRPDLKAIIHELQPYRRKDRGESPERDPLWVLNELAREDRHQTLHVIRTVHESTTFSVGKRDESGKFHVAPFSGSLRDDIRFGPVKDGAVIAKFIIESADPDVEVNCKFAFRIALSEASAFGQQPVLDTLSAILNYVYRSVLSRFQESF